MDPRNEKIPEHILPSLRKVRSELNDFELEDLYREMRLLILQLAVVLWDLAGAQEALIPKPPKLVD